jgi:hypothetical protein
MWCPLSCYCSTDRLGLLVPLIIPRMLLMSSKADTVAPVEALVSLPLVTTAVQVAVRLRVIKTCTKQHDSATLDSVGLFNFPQENLLRYILFCGIQAVNTTIKINQSNCLHWFSLITATCFDPHLGPSSGNFVKYVLCYWNILIWIHISVNHYNHIIHVYCIFA